MSAEPVLVEPDETIEERPKTATVPLKALGRRLICRQRRRGKTASGLYVESVHSSPRLAPWRVVAVGERCRDAKVGDAVCLEAGGPAIFEFGGEKWCFVEERFVQAILTDERLQSDETIHPDEIAGRKFSTGHRYME